MSDWQPIETAPRGETVLLYFPPTKPKHGRGVGMGSMIQVGTPGAYPHRPPTHWLPIPPAPLPGKESA